MEVGEAHRLQPMAPKFGWAQVQSYQQDASSRFREATEKLAGRRICRSLLGCFRLLAGENDKVCEFGGGFSPSLRRSNSHTLSSMTFLTPEARVLEFCKRRPVVTLTQLRAHLPLAPITIHRALKVLGTFSSFNHNARYYSLADRPRFDANGLWFYRSIGFSRHRTLTKTLVALVHDSATGATPEELTSLLRTPVGNLLASLARQQQLTRRRLGHRVVYLASDPQQQQQQWTRRQKDNDSCATPSALSTTWSPTTVLPLLAELIRSPEASIDQLAHTLKRQGVSLEPPDVRAILGFYQLEKKEARCRSPWSFRMSSTPASSNCVSSGHFRKPPFTPSTGWPSRATRPARRCPRSSRRGSAASSAFGSAPSAVVRCFDKQARRAARVPRGWRVWSQKECVTPMT